MWLDGVCKKCGSLVIETGSSSKDAEENPEMAEVIRCSYYKNMCLNAECEEHHWHYVGDMEYLDYYKHDPKIDKKITIPHECIVN